LQPPTALSLGQRLLRERKRLIWSQQRLAAEIGATSMSINRWEHDKAIPQAYYREQLCRVFDLSVDELFGYRSGEKEIDLSWPIWNVPLPRNPFFTGREEVLKQLHEALCLTSAVTITQVQAIGGLGGIGKTHTAVEYAYRYRDGYQAILWVRADTHEVLNSDFAALGAYLQLPEKDDQDQQRIIEEVKHWLNEHTGWLLILDNVEDLSLTQRMLPSIRRGHVLMTSLVQATGALAHCINLEEMEPEEGALLLLRRSKRIKPDAPLEGVAEPLRASALEISQVLGGLPLALDQAGAYIEETACSLPHYLDCYRTRDSALLAYRGAGAIDHPSSVTTTFSLLLEQVERRCPAAADLLRLCVFLHPDAIPEEAISAGVSDLGPLLQPVANDPITFDAIIAELLRFSLLRRNSESQTLTIHRLVQAVLRERMEQEEQRLWAERSVQVVNKAFPDSGEEETWGQCQRLLSQANAGAALIEDWNLVSLQAGQLLLKLGAYLYEHAQYPQAEKHLLKSQAILLELLGEVHPETAACYNELAVLYMYWGKYEQVEALAQRALTIREQVLDQADYRIVESLSNLAGVYYNRGEYARAEPLFQRALALQEQRAGLENPPAADLLHNLSALYGNLEKFDEAGLLAQQALAIRERNLGADHALTALSLSSLANIYMKLGKYDEAEALHLRALAIREQLMGKEHAFVAASLNDLALLYQDQGRIDEAEPLFVRALAIRERTLGPEHQRTLQTLDHLAFIYAGRGRYAEAESLYERALAIRVKVLGQQHADTMLTRQNYAEMLQRVHRARSAGALKSQGEQR
jgi:tetratricopeptide (TPR) repeat protein/transcriptional regulator with XRE-family HTH domain